MKKKLLICLTALLVALAVPTFTSCTSPAENEPDNPVENKPDNPSNGSNESNGNTQEVDTTDWIVPILDWNANRKTVYNWCDKNLKGFKRGNCGGIIINYENASNGFWYNFEFELTGDEDNEDSYKLRKIFCVLKKINHRAPKRFMESHYTILKHTQTANEDTYHYVSKDSTYYASLVDRKFLDGSGYYNRVTFQYGKRVEYPHVAQRR